MKMFNYLAKKLIYGIFYKKGLANSPGLKVL